MRKLRFVSGHAFMRAAGAASSTRLQALDFRPALLHWAAKKQKQDSAGWLNPVFVPTEQNQIFRVC